MTVTLATVRYVKALFAAAQKAGQRDVVLAELRSLGELLDGSPELRAALLNPRLPAAARKRVLLAAGLDTAVDLVQDFVSLCLDRGRPEVIREAAEEFARLDREARGVVVARVQSAEPLGDELRASLQAKIEEVTTKTVELQEEVVPELIGGVRILIGSRMYDGSVRRRLDDLAEHLRTARL